MIKPMKLLFLLFLHISMVSASGNRVVAKDFTVTDVSGKEHHLYNILDAGNYVLLKFTSFG